MNTHDGRFVATYAPIPCPACGLIGRLTSRQAQRIYYFACPNRHRFKALLNGDLALTVLLPPKKEKLSKIEEQQWRALRKKMRGILDKRSIVPPERRAKISAALKGRKVPPEVVAKRAAAQTGLKRSPEIKAKFSAAQKGRTFTEEARRKMSISKLGKKLSEEHKKSLRSAQQKRREREQMEKYYGKTQNI